MKKIICVILVIASFVGLTGCAKEKETVSVNLFYVNLDGNALIQEVCDIPEGDTKELLEQVLQTMEKPRTGVEYQSAIPKGVELTEYRLKDNMVQLEFNEEYLKMKKSTEILLRAAFVQAVVQLPGVDFVSFYVEDMPLEDNAGNIVGYMRAEDFVQNTGSALSSYQVTDLRLYFATEDGTHLKVERRKDIHYNTNTSIEKLVVEQLMKGPNSDKVSATISNAIKLLGVSVKDGICYVNFDSSFLTEGYNQIPEVTIYSIVNSIIANGNATSVQILVEGSNEGTYKGSVDFSDPLQWKAELLEE